MVQNGVTPRSDIGEGRQTLCLGRHSVASQNYDIKDTRSLVEVGDAAQTLPCEDKTVSDIMQRERGAQTLGK